MDEPIFSPHRPVSTEPLRLYLAKILSAEDIDWIAGANYGRAQAELAAGFHSELAGGPYGHMEHEGNAYECCILMFHDERARLRLFAAWWIGTFCSDEQNVVLIENLTTHVDKYVWYAGFESLVWELGSACSELGAVAAHASIPFVAWLYERDAMVNDPIGGESTREFYRKLVRRLAAIESNGY
jgi:hypothetical protein